MLVLESIIRILESNRMHWWMNGAGLVQRWDGPLYDFGPNQSSLLEHVRMRSLLFLYSVPSTQYLANTLFHGLIFFFILLKQKGKKRITETNTLWFSPFHVLDTIKSAFVVAYISGTISSCEWQTLVCILFLWSALFSWGQGSLSFVDHGVIYFPTWQFHRINFSFLSKLITIGHSAGNMSKQLHSR